MADLPESVTSRIVLAPIEDVVLPILRDAFPDMPVYTLLPNDVPYFPFLVARKSRSFGGWAGDPRLIDVCGVDVLAYTQDPDGDEAGALVSEAVRVALHQAWMDRRHVPGKGYVLSARLATEPHRIGGWSETRNGSKPEALPDGVWCYQATYEIAVRRER